MPKKIPLKIKLALYQRAAGMCEARLKDCAYWGSDPHHRKLRSRGGTNALENLLLLCRSCHDRVTRMAQGTSRFRTHSWQKEGYTEDGERWIPPNLT